MNLILRGGLAGIIGVLACTSINLILYFLGFVPTTGIHYNAILLTPPGTSINTISMAIGVIGGLVSGFFIGTIVAYLLEKTGYDYAWLKGIGVGIILWPVHVTFIPSMAPRLYRVVPPLMVLTCVFLEVIFGLVTGLMIQYFAEHTVFRRNRIR